MKNITLLFILFVSILNTSCSKNKPRATEHFSFHLLAEPKDLDPAHIRGSSGSYLFNNLYRGLYSYGNDKLKPENIESCRWLSELKLSCTLKNKQWSNGEKIKAQDYIRTFRRLFNKNTKTYQTEHLLNIKNAKKILAGTAFPINLEVSSSKSNQIIFELVKPDSNFLNILASPSFSPTYSKNNYETNQTTATVTNGPYKVKKWIKGSYAVLTPNKYYDKKWELRSYTF